MDEISRRTAARAIAWSAPAIALAVTVPQAAASVPDPTAPQAAPLLLCCDPGYLEVSVTNPPSAAGAIVVEGWRDASGAVWAPSSPRLLEPNTRASVSFPGASDCDAPTGWVLWRPQSGGDQQAIWVDLSAVINPDCVF
ncbi:hypothetical protein ARHIZOSPH14_23320 [Agromyces rhizosphaerae]|uniref:Secreted protein n=1 Tax=Agromyces rhizosphaerae TaxID=88374 RepID=A0A9W6CXE5_9MICO|nr:hypothetical protein [Agromyces rhizosphaerae]GLI28090.1 hypothetical protein ARHIZOSPH14_23320 [Agromyces rhizosphaerae]